MLEDLESATSPGADSDPYHSFPNTPANASWTPSEGPGQDPQAKVREMRFLSGPLVWPQLIPTLLQRKADRKEIQKHKKRDDRAAETLQFTKLKGLLGLQNGTKIEILEKGEGNTVQPIVYPAK
jgi:hypothetical protein